MTRRRLPIRIFDAVGRQLARLRPPPSFADSEERFLAEARKATGLDDFGDDAFREALRVLLRAYDEEARFTPFGRMLVRGEITGALKARLALQDGWNRRPEVLRRKIRRPLFILGLPRSGTTALHFLLAQDPANQVLEYWLGAAPEPRPPRDTWAARPEFKAAARSIRMMYWLDPDLRAIHLLTPDGPDECRHLFVQSFLDHTFDSNATIPSYTRWFAAQDMEPAYARHRDALKLIGADTPDARWVLKYPAHMGRLRTLLDTYPDACIVQTHRDPSRVLPSVCSLIAGWRGLYETGVDLAALGDWQLDFVSGLVENAMRIREPDDPARWFDLSFDEITGDPVAAIARLYDHFGFAWTDAGERAMRAWLDANPQGKHGGHRYRAEDYGLSDARIAERFADYLTRFDVRREGTA